jgi:hypothetical protein
MRIFSITVFLIIFIGCSSNGIRNGILPHERMQPVVYDLIRVDEFINNYVIKDSTIDIKKKRSILYEQVFKIHKTSREQFFASYKYYQQHPKLQKELFDSLQQAINRRNLAAAKADTATKTP